MIVIFELFVKVPTSYSTTLFIRSFRNYTLIVSMDGYTHVYSFPKLIDLKGSHVKSFDKNTIVFSNAMLYYAVEGIVCR